MSLLGSCRFRIAAFACVVVTCATQALGQGIILPAAGAVNRGMGGATTATGIEAIGSMYWNPATVSQLPTSELAFGFEALYVNYNLSSSFPYAGNGSSDAEIGAMPIPTIAWVHQTCDPNVTVGLGLFGVGGFAANFRADPTNPIPSPPFALGGVGVGGIKTEGTFFQLNPAISIRMTERLSIGFGPVVGLGKISLDDNIFAPLNANLMYPRGDGTRYHWGLGAQLGIHYIHDCCWEFGANVKSPTWFESMRYFSEDAAGLPRTDKVDFDLPLIVSGGVAYRGLPGTVLTCDLRYFNYADAAGFGSPAGYNPDGSVTGLGWRDVFSVSVGVQRQLSHRLVGRAGYMYASNLFDEANTFFNVGSALNYRHMPTIGCTYHLNESASLSVAYNYVTRWGSTGPYVLPGIGPIPGTSVSTELDAHVAVIGVNVRY